MLSPCPASEATVGPSINPALPDACKTAGDNAWVDVTSAYNDTDTGSLGGLYRVGSLAGLAISLSLVALALQKFVLHPAGDHA